MDFYSTTTQHTLDQIARHCPESMSAYLQCINRADESGSIFFNRSLVENDMSESWAKFRKHVKKLALENLLEWHAISDGIHVILADVNDE